LPRSSRPCSCKAGFQAGEFISGSCSIQLGKQLAQDDADGRLGHGDLARGSQLEAASGDPIGKPASGIDDPDVLDAEVQIPPREPLAPPQVAGG